MHNLDFKKFTLSRIEAFISQIKLAKEVDFPYSDSKDALEKIESHIASLWVSINQSVLEGGGLKSKCAVANKELFNFQRYLGYILKSSESSNNFEIHSSFKRIASSILGENSKLIISSEWENYSPVNFINPKELSDFVFIGLPISEVHNSLIVPLSGHELGHSVFDKMGFASKYWMSNQSNIEGDFLNIEKNQILDISLMKCAEYFCDCVGMGLFGESYLFAFSYLLSPFVTKEFTTSHPNMENRIEAMRMTAKELGHNLPNNLDELFKIQENTDNDRFQERLEESERIAFKQVEDIIEDVKNLLSAKNLLYKKSTEHDKFKSDLLSMVPISQAKSLADITNASWLVYLDIANWTNAPLLSYVEKVSLLNELTLKSFEILEINQRLGKL